MSDLVITINILSYNRKNEIRNTLNKVFSQSIDNIEVIVVDNASTDGTVEMISRDFPDVILIRMKQNIGIAGWNEGFKVAKGKYILVLDDDSYPETSTISKAIKSMESDNKIGVVALKVYNNLEKRFETEHLDNRKPNTFIGCGALIRKSIIEKTGGFSSLLFLYEHETEFSMRVYNAGYNIKFCDDAIVIHQGSLSNRIIKKKSDVRRQFYLIRNYVIILFLHFSLHRILIFLPQLIAARLLISLPERNFLTTLKGFINGFLLIPEIIRFRFPLKKEIQKFYRYGNYMGRFVRGKSYT